MKCCVPHCSTDNRKERVYMLAFPKDKSLRKKWLKFCKMSENTLNFKVHRVCIHHFRQEDIQRGLQVEMGFGKVKLLNPGACPSKNGKQTSQRKEKRLRLQKSNHQKKIKDLLKSYKCRNNFELSRMKSSNFKATDISELPSTLTEILENLKSKGFSETPSTSADILQRAVVKPTSGFGIGFDKNNSDAPMDLSPNPGVKYFLVLKNPASTIQDQPMSLESGSEALFDSSNPFRKSPQKPLDVSLEEDNPHVDLAECVKDFLIKEEFLTNDEFLNEHLVPNNNEFSKRYSSSDSMLLHPKREPEFCSPIQQVVQTKFGVPLKEDTSRGDLSEFVKDFLIKQEFMDAEFFNKHKLPNYNETTTRSNTPDSMDSAALEFLEENTMLLDPKKEAELHHYPIHSGPQEQFDAPLEKVMPRADLSECIKDFLITDEFINERPVPRIKGRRQKRQAALRSPIQQNPPKRFGFSLEEDIPRADWSECAKDFLIKKEYSGEQFIPNLNMEETQSSASEEGLLDLEPIEQFKYQCEIVGMDFLSMHEND